MSEIESAMVDIKALLKEKYPSLYKTLNKKMSKVKIRRLLKDVSEMVERYG